MSIPTFVVLTKVLYGPGIRKRIDPELKALGAKRVLFVSDAGLKKAGVADKVTQVLDESGIPYLAFTDIEENPSTLAVDKGVELAKPFAPEAVVICAGGSGICAGKGIALSLTNSGKLIDYHAGSRATGGIHKIPPLPMLVLPTTAGSGAEVAPRFFLKHPDTGDRLRFGGDDCYAKVALLDPELLLALPPKIALASSVDALCHAIEAYLSTDANIITDTLALGAIRLLAQNMGPAALTRDAKARETVLVASTMANMACGNAKLGLVHALTCGDFNGHSHGMSNSVMLPYMLEYLLPVAEEKMAKLAGALGEPLTGISARDAAAAISAVHALYIKLGIPRSLVEIGVKEASLDELVNETLRQGAVALLTSIRPANRSEIEGIFRRAFAG